MNVSNIIYYAWKSTSILYNDTEDTNKFFGRETIYIRKYLKFIHILTFI